MEFGLCSPKPNSQSGKEGSKMLKVSTHFVEDSDVHCPQGTSLMKSTLLEDPSVVNNSADLPQGEAVPSVVLKKRRKRTKSSARELITSDPLCSPEPENLFMESCAGIFTSPNPEKDKKRRLRKKQNKMRKILESNDRSCESNMPIVDSSLQPPAPELSGQRPELAVAVPVMDKIGTKTNSESSEPVADLSCIRKKKKKRCKIQGINDESCGDDKRCDLLAGFSLEENTMPAIDPSQQLPDSEFSDQNLELPQQCTEGIRATSSEGPEPHSDPSCSLKKKKRKKKRRHETHEGDDKSCNLSVGTSSGGNIIPGVDLSVQLPSVTIISEQELETEQSLVEGVGTRTSSESPKPIEDLSCLQTTKKRIWNRKRKINESDVKSCDPSVDSSLVENIIPGADPSLQPPLAMLSEKEIEVPQSLLGESTFQEMNEDKEHNKRSNASGNSDTDHDVRACLPGQVVKDVKHYEKIYDNSLSDVSELCPTDMEESSPMLEEQNGSSRIADGGSRKKVDPEMNYVSREWVNIKNSRRHDKVRNSCRKMDKSCNPDSNLGCFEENGVKGTSLHCADASHEAEDITDTDWMETRIEVPSVPPLGVKSEVDVATIVKEENLSQISKSPDVPRSLVSCSKKKLLILDLNGLLADIVQQERGISNRFKPDTMISGKAVFKRPYCNDFLEFCFEKFNVGVWSSRTKKNVNRVIDFLLPDTKDKLLFCWNQFHCTPTRFNTIGNNNKPLVLKELRNLWEKADHLPWVKGEYNESNTLLLDDSPYKALRNPANTAIFPYPYRYKDRKDKSLGKEGEIRSYLEGLAMADNVQEYVEQHPFGQRPITKSSLSWGFYHRVMKDEVRQRKDTSTLIDG